MLKLSREVFDVLDEIIKHEKIPQLLGTQI